MSYSNYTLDLASRTFNLTVEAQRLFDRVEPVEPSPWLRETLEKGRSLAWLTEKARSEFIVAPILLTCRDLMDQSIQIYSGVRLDVDPERGLTGECDFVLGQAPSALMLQAPLLIVVEAKKNDIEEGMGQCAAQMVAARLFNECRRHAVPVVYGCVTTGEAWQFLKLLDSHLLTDAERYYIDRVDMILGILLAILKTSAPSEKTSDAA